MSARRSLSVLMAALLTVAGMAVPVTVAALTATTTTVAWPANPIVQNAYSDVSVTVTPVPTGGGVVTLYRLVPGSDPVPVYVNSVSGTTGIGIVRLPGDSLVPEGDYDYYAAFTDGGTFADSQSTTHLVEIRRIQQVVALDASKTTVYPGQSATLTATTTQYTSELTLRDAVDGAAAVDVETKPTLSTGFGGMWAEFTVSGLSLGTHEFTAVALENEAYTGGTSPVKTIVVTKRPTEIFINPLGTAQANHAIDLHVGIIAQDPIESAVSATGTITLKDGTTTIGTLPVTDGSAMFTGQTFSTGTHALSASYTGDATYASDTVSLDLPVAADAVEATGVGVAYTTFYPYKDGYRDTLAIRGSRQEPVGVTIRIYSPAGSLLRTVTVARATGSYSYAWTGRNSGGTMYAAGKYKVVQTLSDAAGTKKTVTSYSTLSKKRLYTYTTSVTKKGSSLSAKGSGGTGSVSVNATSGYAKLYAGSGWAVAGWELTLPTATFYKSLSFKVYAKSRLSVPPTEIAMQNFAWCPRSTSWVDTCFDRWKGIGNSSNSLAWYSSSGSATSNRSGRVARGLVDVEYSTVYVYKVRFTVKYQVLK